jgi:tRNA (guanine-N7-)-methyltransferase
MEDMNNVYAIENRKEDLNIKTHYESLDIANSNRIHYLQFSLPSNELEQTDKLLQELLKNTEPSKGF